MIDLILSPTLLHREATVGYPILPSPSLMVYLTQSAPRQLPLQTTQECSPVLVRCLGRNPSPWEECPAVSREENHLSFTLVFLPQPSLLLEKLPLSENCQRFPLQCIQTKRPCLLFGGRELLQENVLPEQRRHDHSLLMVHPSQGQQ